jgi:hypothetical protein
MGKKMRFQEFTARKMGAKQMRRGVRAVGKTGSLRSNVFNIFKPKKGGVQKHPGPQLIARYTATVF